MKVINVTKNTTVADEVKIAAGFFERSRGLLGRKGLNPKEGLLLQPCNSIHMLFMRFALDAVFLSSERVVVRTIKGLRPWRLSPLVRQAREVLELPVGTIQKAQIQAGDFLMLTP